MKKMTGVLSGCLMFFTAAVAAAGIDTIEMASGLAGPNLKSLAAERSTRYALMVSYPLGFTAQPTILDMATGKTGQKCGVDKKCRSPFNFRAKDEQKRLNDELQQAASAYVAERYSTAAAADAGQPRIYFGDLYTTVLWRTNREQCLTLYSLTLNHEWESCEKIVQPGIALRDASAAGIDAAITDTDARHIMLLNQGPVGDSALVDVKSNRLIAPCNGVKCKSPSTPVATQAVKLRPVSGKQSIQILAEDSYTLLGSNTTGQLAPPCGEEVKCRAPFDFSKEQQKEPINSPVQILGEDTYTVRAWKGSECITIYSLSSGTQYELCSPPWPRLW